MATLLHSKVEVNDPTSKKYSIIETRRDDEAGENASPEAMQHSLMHLKGCDRMTY